MLHDQTQLGSEKSLGLVMCLRLKLFVYYMHLQYRVCVPFISGSFSRSMVEKVLDDVNEMGGALSTFEQEISNKKQAL